jgi:hypothetical protein
VRLGGSVLVDRPDTDVFLVLSDLSELRAWTAWLPASDPELVGDGTSLGSELLGAPGRGAARLRLVAAALREIRFELELPARVGGPARAQLVYRLQDVGASATIVMLEVVVAQGSGAGRLPARRLARRAPDLAERDLAGLKAHLESLP